MRKSSLIVLSLVLCLVLSTLSFPLVGASSELWSQTYGGDGIEGANSLVVTSDGGFALAGGSLLVKTDANGVMEWNKTYDIFTNSMIVTSDGGFALAGTKNFHAESDFWLVKTDVYGNLEWNQTYGGTWYESNPSLVETSDGGYALAGRTYDYGGSEVFDFFLVKTDAKGNMEWNKTYGTIDYVEDCLALVETSDGGYALAGHSWDFVSSGDSDFWLVKTDGDGDMQWNRTYGGPKHERDANSLVETFDGGYALAGNTMSFGAGEFDFWLVKTDTYGNMEWNQTYGGAESEGADSLIVTSDGGYAIAGYTSSFGAGSQDFYLVKTDAYGNMLWNQTYGGVDNESADSLVETSDGGYALAGNTESFASGVSDFWLVKTDELGIPEFPSWIILSLFLTVTLIGVIYRKRMI